MSDKETTLNDSDQNIKASGYILIYDIHISE